MATERGLDRLTYFTDAIAAIAITLLILPVVDHVASGSSTTPAQWLVDNLPSLLAFALSFVIIARFWMSHHAVFEHVAMWTPRLRVLSLTWAFTIVFLPLPTAMLPVWPTNTVVAGLYIGSMLATSAVTTAMVVLVRGSAIEDAQNPIGPMTVRWSVIATVQFAVAFALGQIPSVTYFGLLVLLSSAVLRPLFWLYDARKAARA